MPNHSTQFEATPGGMVLTNAILLYSPASRYIGSGAGAAAFARSRNPMCCA